MSEPFIAEIRIFAGHFAPTGWAFCDGQLLPISQNTALFSLLGNTYGGDARTTMGLPNMQGRSPMHPGRGPGLTARRLGQALGSETVTLTEAQIPQHHHSLRSSGESGSTSTPSSNAYLAGSGLDQLYQSNTSADPVDLSEAALSTAGGSQSHNNLQPYLVMNFIIALQGLYPSRA